MKKKIVLLFLLSAMSVSGIPFSKTNTHFNKEEVNYYLNVEKDSFGEKKADAFIDYLATVPGITIYSQHIEFNTTMEPSIITFVQIWNSYMSEQIPTNVSQIKNPQYLGNNTYTSNLYFFNARKKSSESLNFVVAHNPSVANTKVTIENGVTTNTSIGYGFGVYCEGSWGVNVELGASFGINFTSSKQINQTRTYNLSDQNLSAGKYEVFLDYYICNRFYFQYNNSGNVTKIGMYSNCPLPTLQHSFKKIGEI